MAGAPGTESRLKPALFGIGAGAVFALNAPMAALMGWWLLGESLPPRAILGIALTAAGVALAILPPVAAPQVHTAILRIAVSFARG